MAKADENNRKIDEESTGEVDDVVLSDEDFTFENEGETTPDRVKRLREQVKALTEEKREYLDGWQRAKADLVNFKRQSVDERARVVARANEALMEDLLPVIDSFEAALGSDAWEAVDENWRTGVEHIYKELTRVLENNGVREIAPEPGDAFDAKLHESVETEPTDTDSKDNTIAVILQKGYKTNDRVVRSARVRTYESGSEK